MSIVQLTSNESTSKRIEAAADIHFARQVTIHNSQTTVATHHIGLLLSVCLHLQLFFPETKSSC